MNVDNILEGVIVAIIAFLIINAFKKFRDFFASKLSLYNKKFQNTIYKKASFKNLNELTSYASNLIITFISTLFVLGTLFLMIYISNINDRIDNTLESENITSNNDSKYSKIIGNPKTSLEELRAEGKKIYYFTLGLFVFALFNIIKEMIKLYRMESSQNLILEFDQKMRMLKPLISENEFSNLEMQWASMTNKADWEIINKHISEKLLSSELTDVFNKSEG